MDDYDNDNYIGFWNLNLNESRETIMSIFKRDLRHSHMPDEEEKVKTPEDDKPSNQYGDSLVEYKLSPSLEELKKEIKVVFSDSSKKPHDW